MMIVCETCKKEFEKKNQRGRPPKVCYSCKETSEKEKTETKETKEKAQTTGLTPVPVYKPFTSAGEVHVGQTVYYLPNWTQNDTIRRMYAKPLKVTSIAGEDLVLISEVKAGYRHYPATVHHSRVHYKSGVEYLDIKTENDGIMEEEEGDTE